MSLLRWEIVLTSECCLELWDILSDALVYVNIQDVMDVPAAKCDKDLKVLATSMLVAIIT